MQEDILQSIATAESRAAEIKAQANDKAASIIAAAEKSAADIIRSSETQCAELRESSLKQAEEKAADEYAKALSDSRAQAQSYAQSILKYSPTHVGEIVGRLTK